MVIAFSSMGFAFHPSNLTSSGSQSFAESQGDSKGRSPWRAFGDFPRDGKVTRGGGAERPPHGGCGGLRPPLRGAQRRAQPPRKEAGVPHPPSVEKKGERRGGRQPSSQRDLAHRLAKALPFRYNERKYFLLSRRKTTWEQKNRENKNLIE